MNIRIIRTDGTEEQFVIIAPAAMKFIKEQIGAECIDTVNLRDGRVMLVDDTGMVDGKPVNAAATNLYHSVCRPGTTHPICGDVAIVKDADFE